MPDHRQHHARRTSFLLIAGVLICVCPSTMARNNVGLGSVYYQVSYADKRIADLPRIPETNKNIRTVLRIASTPPARRSSRRTGAVLSTRKVKTPPPAANQTYRTHLAWNGRAWVGSFADRMSQQSRVMRTSDLSAPKGWKPQSGRQHPLIRSLSRLRRQQLFWKLAAVDIEADMFKHAGTPLAGRKRWDLQAVRAVGRDVDISIKEHNKALDRLAKQGKLDRKFNAPAPAAVKLPGPTGTVKPLKLDKKWKSACGVTTAIKDVAIPPHRVQVWSAPPMRGRRTYHVAMAHAEAGMFGAFYYVAYCDSNADGLPDSLIARSPLAQSDRPGRWTRWSFTTEAPRVFIGHAWSAPDTAVYLQTASKTDWKGMNPQAYTAPILGQDPSDSCGPCAGNLRIYSVRPPGKPATQPAKKPANSKAPATP